MAKKNNYRVEGLKIYVDLLKLTEKETKEVKKYVELGFELVRIEKEKKKKLSKEEMEAAAEKNPYSQRNIEAFLKKEENKKLFDEYTERFNEQAGTNRKRKSKTTNEVEALEDDPKFTKDGKPKKKGFANCIGWFRGMYDWDEVKKEYILKNND